MVHPYRKTRQNQAEKLGNKGKYGQNQDENQYGGENPGKWRTHSDYKSYDPDNMRNAPKRRRNYQSPYGRQLSKDEPMVARKLNFGRDMTNRRYADDDYSQLRQRHQASTVSAPKHSVYMDEGIGNQAAVDNDQLAPEVKPDNYFNR